LPHVPILSQINPVHALPAYFFNIHFIYLSTPRSCKWLFSFRPVNQKSYMHFSYPPYVLTAQPIHLQTHPFLATVTIFPKINIVQNKPFWTIIFSDEGIIARVQHNGKYTARFHASSVVKVRTSLFWDVRQRVLVITGPCITVWDSSSVRSPSVRCK
jgi:hypothetical protein